MQFNDKLKTLRKEYNYTQEELAEALDVSRQAITKWESGEGVPDVENLKEISKLFNTTIDELIKEEKQVKSSDRRFRAVRELDIDHGKHFDIKLAPADELNIVPSSDEKVKVELLSSEKENLSELVKVKFDDLYNKLDINIKSKRAGQDVIINLYLPEKYIDEIEINGKLKTLNISDLDVQKLEYDGKLKYLNVSGSKGKIVLNTSKSDIEAEYDRFDGSLEVNTIHSTARVKIPTGTKYQAINKGFKNTFIDAVNTEDSANIIELNGAASKLIVIEK
ncbi:helix-turn-helix transcriptional regulator [Candidatus Saccharibacteria bacterium]|nr:helix-turn-helix transcriptional regulator [Candidatus Saccharibacteria bacterium]